MPGPGWQQGSSHHEKLLLAMSLLQPFGFGICLQPLQVYMCTSFNQQWAFISS